MNTKNFLLISLILAFSSVFAQNQQQQQGGASLTREAVEKLLEVLSFECRAEMEAALTEQTDVSLECKQEITQVIREHNIPIQQGNPPPQQQETFNDAQDDSADDIPEPQTQSEGLKVKKEGGIPPIVGILGFVVVFFGAIIGYIVKVNSERGPYVPQKPKKLSKKKVRLENFVCFGIFAHHQSFFSQEEKLKIKKQNLEKLN